MFRRGPGEPVRVISHLPGAGQTVQGYREIVGDAKFFGFAKSVMNKYRYGNISTAQFIAEAKKASGLKGA